MSTVGPEGTDGSPRGDDGPVVLELVAGTLTLPDWHGNTRIDSLRNIVRDGRVSLIFLVAGSTNLVRVNGTARLSVDAGLRARFKPSGQHPRSVMVITVAEVSSQCARALIRLRLWRDGDQSAGLPPVGDFLTEMTQGGLDSAACDAA